MVWPSAVLTAQFVTEVRQQVDRMASVLPWVWIYHFSNVCAVNGRSRGSVSRPCFWSTFVSGGTAKSQWAADGMLSPVHQRRLMRIRQPENERSLIFRIDKLSYLSWKAVKYSVLICICFQILLDTWTQHEDYRWVMRDPSIYRVEESHRGGEMDWFSPHIIRCSPT